MIFTAGGRYRRGFILIFALWVLGFLTVLAVSVAAGIRQRVMLVKKLEERSRMQYVLQAALEQVRSYARAKISAAQFEYTTALKMDLHSNPGIFAQIALGDDFAVVSYDSDEDGRPGVHYGLLDEERKININTTSSAILQRLIERVLGLRPTETVSLAQAMLDWRMVGESQLTGFYSDEYYANLQFPFKKKDADYETLDELLLVRGMTKDYYERLLPYITIYGEGKVNINTASPAVLYALGFDDALIQKILAARRGKDGVDASSDDLIFNRTFDVASAVNANIKLLPEEARAIDAMNAQGLLCVTSYFFSASIKASLHASVWQKKAYAVFSARDNRVLYWREK